MSGTFRVSAGWYGFPQVIQNQATKEQVLFLKRALGAYRLDDVFHQQKLAADPDVVAMSTDFVRVDFGSSFEVATAYVDWLNSVYDATVLELRIAGYDLS